MSISIKRSCDSGPSRHYNTWLVGGGWVLTPHVELEGDSFCLRLSKLVRPDLPKLWSGLPRVGLPVPQECMSRHSKKTDPMLNFSRGLEVVSLQEQSRKFRVGHQHPADGWLRTQVRSKLFNTKCSSPQIKSLQMPLKSTLRRSQAYGGHQ